VFVAGVFGVRAGGMGRSSQMPGGRGSVGVGVRVAVGGGRLWSRLWGMCGRRTCNFSFVCFRCFSYFCKLEKRFYEPGEVDIAGGYCLFGMLIGAAVAYSGYGVSMCVSVLTSRW